MAKKTRKKQGKSGFNVNPASLLKAALQYHQAGELTQAEKRYRQVLQQQPHHAEACHLLGIATFQLGRIQDAIALYQRALNLKPDFPDARTNLGNALMATGEFEAAIQQYQTAIRLNPQDPDIHNNLGNAWIKQGNLEAAIQQYQQAIALNPTCAEAHNNLGNAWSRQDRLDQAIAHYQKALAIQPNYTIAANNLERALAEQTRQQEMAAACQTVLHKLDQLGAESSEIAELTQDIDLLQFGEVDRLLAEQNFVAARQQAQEALTQRAGLAKIIPVIAFIGAYAKSGEHEAAKTQFLDLEDRILNQEISLSRVEKDLLYKRIGFCTPFLRDDLVANITLLRCLGQHYVDCKPRGGADRQPEALSPRPGKKRSPGPLRIGFLSNHFKRSSVGWVTVDWIKALSTITPAIYCYATGQLTPDDLTQQFQQAATQFYQPTTLSDRYARPTDLSQRIEQDQLDILISLDSLTIPVQVDVLQAQPAPICMTWPGFEAPFTCSKNYYLCDWHTHPRKVESYYREILVRLPHSHFAIAGFERTPCERDRLRRQCGIGCEQVVFLCVAHGLKFTPDLVRSQLAILSQVPDSVLVYKGRGDLTVVRSAYQQACESQRVDFNRLKFLKQTPTEEDHRTVYALADVLLDSYPYNGGVHNLEALWFELPLITYKGQQFTARLGYSCLQALDIDIGIANSWQTYIDWGIQLGNNAILRQTVRARLAVAKQVNTLAPLWDPQQYAENLYVVFEALLHTATYY